MKGRTLLVPVLLLIVQNIFSCTNFLITKEATVDGSSIITYSADAFDLYGELYYWPRADHAANDSLKIYDWDSKKYLGKIKQVPHTYQVVGNMNEFQLAISETTTEGRAELRDTTAKIDYGSIIYITLQRARTAREAIKVIAGLMDEYGYYSEAESFSIADPNEVWIMEISGKGPGNKGAVWVARRIPPGYICGYANQSRITKFPLDDPQNCLYAKDVISFAINHGYFKGKKEDFSFSDAYGPLSFEGARQCEARVWSGFRKVNADMDQYEDYAMGKNLSHRMPLWIKPDKKLSLKDVYGMMRDYYQGTPMDMSKGPGAGPYGCIVRWRPLVWKLDGNTYFNNRPISVQQTGFSFVAQCRNWLPNPVGGVLWFGVDDTYSTVYTPMYCGISRVPESFAVGNGSIMQFSDSAAFWIFNQVSNFAYTRYSAMIPYIQKKQSYLENKYIAESGKMDKQAAELYKQDPQKSIELITTFSDTRGDSTVAEWKDLYHFLFTRFVDGSVKTTIPGQPVPEVQQPGYGREYYENLVKQTGNKFLEEGK